MGELIYLDEHRQHRSRPALDAAPAFFFDLACPFSYLAAERIERILGEAEWLPVPGAAFASGNTARRHPPTVDELRAAAERRASGLRLPLIWPERYPAAVPGALRAAAYAVKVGAGDRFALAAARMAFCGGYDLNDPAVLTNVAAASGLAADACLAAAADASRDQGLHATATWLRACGVRRLPAIRLAGALRDAEAVFTEQLLAPPA